MSVTRRQTASGTRWDVRLRDPAGRVYTRTFRTRKAAGAFEDQERADRSRGAWVDPRLASTTLDEWAAAWLARPGKRASTLAADEVALRVHVRPVLGRRPLGSITPPDVQALVNHWTTTMAPATAVRTYGVLRAVLAAATQADLILRSPCRGIRLPALTHATRPQLGPDELDRVARAMDARYAPMVTLAGMTGLRFGECAGLRVGDLDLLRGSLTVASSVGRGSRGRSVAGPPKSTASHRTMTLPRPCAEALAAHLRALGLTGADEGALVFASPRGGLLHYPNFRARFWRPAVAAAGFPGLGFHDLRRCAATALVRAGVDVKTAQARLGHSDPCLTLGLYAQVTSAGDRDAAGRLEEHFGDASRDGRAMGAPTAGASAGPRPL